jgi:sortase A
VKKISVFFIVVGIMVALSPVIAQKYNAYQEQKAIEQWLNSDAPASNTEAYQDTNPEDNYTQLQDAFTESNTPENTSPQSTSSVIYSAYDKSTIKKATTPKKIIPRKPNLSSQKLLGVIKISKIGVYLPIVEGANKDQLREGVGHIPGTARLGQPGNSALAGHRNYAFATYFNRLGELKAGDQVTLITKTAEYNYSVYDRFVVLPSDTSVLKGSKKDNIITLITCTPPNIATHRLIVKARLSSTKNKD